jgi:intracellular sulfur oxidation DsrE/DsrF family protein
MNPVISDETLHAFVDGELDVAESEVLTARIRGDQVLAQRVCALRSMQSMVRLAYAKPPAAASDAPRASLRRQLVQRCALGCLVLFTGLSGGWALRSLESQTAAADTPATILRGYQAVSLAREADPNRVMLHLDSAAPERMQATLDQAERLLDEAERQGRLMQLEIVANSHGLDLMRAGVSPHAARIARMTQRHTNLQWVACSQTIARFTGEGQTVELLPAARVAPTAIGEIVTRLQQGWTYVRV